MKSKFFIISLLLVGATSIMSAQETKDNSSNKKWKDNWFLSVGVGAQASTNPDSDFGKTITPLVNLSVGKFVSPVWGFRGQLYGWKSKQETTYLPWNGKNTNPNEREENYIGINADAMINLTNLIAGYNPDRKFELNFFVGPSLNIAKSFGGWTPAYRIVDSNGNTITGSITATPGSTIDYQYELDPSKCDFSREEMRWLIGASLGLGAKYNINNYWAIDAELRGQVTPSILGSMSSGKTDGYLYLSVGTTYTFGGKKFVPCAAKVDQKAVNEEVNKYREEVARLQNELANQKPVIKEVVKEVVKENTVANPLAVFFKIGSAKIDEYGMVNLQMIAKAMKANPSEKYKIAGYCDKATGSNASNQALSEKRAKAVYDALIAEGVSADQLELVGFGGTANMFGKDYLNRVVILE